MYSGTGAGTVYGLILANINYKYFHCVCSSSFYIFGQCLYTFRLNSSLIMIFKYFILDAALLVWIGESLWLNFHLQVLNIYFIYVCEIFFCFMYMKHLYVCIYFSGFYIPSVECNYLSLWKCLLSLVMFLSHGLHRLFGFNFFRSSYNHFVLCVLILWGWFRKGRLPWVT